MGVENYGRQVGGMATSGPFGTGSPLGTTSSTGTSNPVVTSSSPLGTPSPVGPSNPKRTNSPKGTGKLKGTSNPKRTNSLKGTGKVKGTSNPKRTNSLKGTGKLKGTCRPGVASSLVVLCFEEMSEHVHGLEQFTQLGAVRRDLDSNQVVVGGDESLFLPIEPLLPQLYTRTSRGLQLLTALGLSPFSAPVEEVEVEVVVVKKVDETVVKKGLEQEVVEDEVEQEVVVDEVWQEVVEDEVEQEVEEYTDDEEVQERTNFTFGEEKVPCVTEYTALQDLFDFLPPTHHFTIVTDNKQRLVRQLWRKTGGLASTEGLIGVVELGEVIGAANPHLDIGATTETEELYKQVLGKNYSPVVENNSLGNARRLLSFITLLRLENIICRGHECPQLSSQLQPGDNLTVQNSVLSVNEMVPPAQLSVEIRKSHEDLGCIIDMKMVEVVDLDLGEEGGQDNDEMEVDTCGSAQHVDVVDLTESAPGFDVEETDNGQNGSDIVGAGAQADWDRPGDVPTVKHTDRQPESRQNTRVDGIHPAAESSTAAEKSIDAASKPDDVGPPTNIVSIPVYTDTDHREKTSRKSKVKKNKSQKVTQTKEVDTEENQSNSSGSSVVEENIEAPVKAKKSKEKKRLSQEKNGGSCEDGTDIVAGGQTDSIAQEEGTNSVKKKKKKDKEKRLIDDRTISHAEKDQTIGHEENNNNVNTEDKEKNSREKKRKSHDKEKSQPIVETCRSDKERKGGSRKEKRKFSQDEDEPICHTDKIKRPRQDEANIPKNGQKTKEMLPMDQRKLGGTEKQKSRDWLCSICNISLEKTKRKSHLNDKAHIKKAKKAEKTTEIRLLQQNEPRNIPIRKTEESVELSGGTMKHAGNTNTSTQAKEENRRKARKRKLSHEGGAHGEDTLPTGSHEHKNVGDRNPVDGASRQADVMAPPDFKNCPQNVDKAIGQNLSHQQKVSSPQPKLKWCDACQIYFQDTTAARHRFDLFHKFQVKELALARAKFDESIVMLLRKKYGKPLTETQTQLLRTGPRRLKKILERRLLCQGGRCPKKHERTCDDCYSIIGKNDKFHLETQFHKFMVKILEDGGKGVPKILEDGGKDVQIIIDPANGGMSTHQEKKKMDGRRKVKFNKCQGNGKTLENLSSKAQRQGRRREN